MIFHTLDHFYSDFFVEYLWITQIFQVLDYDMGKARQRGSEYPTNWIKNKSTTDQIQQRDSIYF